MPAGNTLRTPWKPESPCPLPEYPRPQLTRPLWKNLNGLWEYSVLPRESAAPQVYSGQILVPFAIESSLSGVQQPLLPDQKLWYRRRFSDPRQDFFQHEPGSPGRVLLHFGAVDYECEVWINGELAGRHQGGFLPFSLDITGLLAEGENELVVSVWDPTDTGLQPRGKQCLKPKGIWYSPVSGIWQTVWLESVPPVYIHSLRLTPDVIHSRLEVETRIQGIQGLEELDGLRVEVEAFAGEEKIAACSVAANTPAQVVIPNPHLWSPSDPFLYDLRVRLVCEDLALDEVGSYFAMRRFGLLPDADGHLRFAMNGEPLFLYGPLDQGYFPDGLYTPPSDQAMVSDIEYIRSIGCNLIRKHVKVEPLRWYYHCDRLGMIVSQDMPNGGAIDGMLVSGLTQILGFHRKDTVGLKRFGRDSQTNRAEFYTELLEMVGHLYNAPCIAVWVPFNESWGQFQAKKTAGWIQCCDSTRLVDHASGWFDQGGGDFQSAHIYFKKLKRPKPDGRAFVLSEFGGYSLPIAGHQWDETRRFGYRFFDTCEALTAGYLALLENELAPLIPQGLAAAVYTQTSDVETEINGYLTYDRKVEKMDAQVLRQAHEKLIAQVR